MTTTAIVAEILIVGLQASAWVALLVGWIYGTSLIHEGLWRGWEGLGTILILATAYSLGIVIDRLADSLFRRIAWLGGGGGHRRQRLQVMRRDDPVSRFLEYQRSRLRIARATVLNVLLIAAAGTVFLIRRTDLPGSRVWAFDGLMAGLLAMTLFAAGRIRKAYEESLEDAGRLPGADPVSVPPPTDTMGMRAAAVCYQVRDDGIHLLLVRTTSGTWWTFPKGKIEKKERKAPHRAAEREAREEAGVHGRADPDPLGTYLFPRRLRRRTVVAYLLPVQSLTKPEEESKDRSPTWFPVEEALRELRDDHEPDIQEGYGRVVGEALRRIPTPTEHDQG